MDRNDVIDLLTIVQMGDNRTIGDPDIGYWLGLLGPYDRDECYDAIAAHRREQPGVWLEPGHVIGRVRATRRDRIDRMDPEERYKSLLDRAADRAEKTGLAVVQSTRVQPAGEALPRGTYIEADPAGWTYGMPRNALAWDAEPTEADRLRQELDARIRVYREKNPECASNAEAEHAIRLKDREKADAVMRKWKRGEMADVLGGAFPSGPNDTVIDAEVVNLDNSEGGQVDEELF